MLHRGWYTERSHRMLAAVVAIARPAYGRVMDLPALGAFMSDETPGFATLETVASTLGCGVEDARRRLEALEADEYVRGGEYSDAPSTPGYYLTQKGRHALTDAVWD